MIGELLDHYRVLELIGSGAMGVVYKALDENLDRQVAIKVMSAEARNDPDFVERFRQEARMQGSLNHANIAMLFDYFIHDGAPVAVMELIDGESLEQLIRRRGAVPAHECIPIFRQALRGVAAAHRAGIIHRDLKPSNLMVTRDDIVKVMDFGIAKRQGTPGATKVSSTSIGSPLYMAPEQILGRAVDRRTDVYALGLTLYELLSGYRPFNPRGKAEYMILNAHVNDEPEPPTVYRLGIPQPVVEAVMRSLAKDPNARFQSADDFLAALPDVPAPAAALATAAPPVAVAPNAAAPLPAGSKATAPRVGPTGTVALEKSPPASVPAAATGSPGGTMVFDYGSATRPDPGDSAVFDFSASTLLRESERPTPPLPAAAAPAATVKITPPAARANQSAAASSPAPPAAPQVSRAAPPRPARRLRARAFGLATLLLAALALATLIPYAERLYATLPSAPRIPGSSAREHAQAPAAPQAPPSTAAAPLPEPSSSGVEPAAAPPPNPSVSADPTPAPDAIASATVPAPASAPPDLAGTWRGAYVDASGRQLLRVVSLSIFRVYDGGGIEGTLQYQAASGDGECQLHPRGSRYSAGDERLQLRPEGCSPHYPKELGVPLDFDGVRPRASALTNGRIEAPTGEVVRVKLTRVSGV